METKETILPELIGKLAELPEHIQKTIRAYGRAYGAACYRTALESPEVQALRKDAERYRWLRDMIENQDLVIAKVGSWSLESWSGDDPDHYIDAAMEQKK